MLRTFRIGGIHPPENKLSAGKKITALATPKQVIIPLSQHIGAPAQAVVKKGDLVKVGTLLAKAGGFVSANIHSSVSGKVNKIDNALDASGYKRPAIYIDVEGDEWEETIDRSETLVKECALSSKEIVDKIAASGIVGLGGATFPTQVKLMPPPGNKAEIVIINAVECEPYLTSDHSLMLEKGEQILVGVTILMKAVNVNKAVIGIENNKPDAIAHLQKLAVNYKGIEIMPLKVQYPQGGEKQLIDAVIRRQVKSGALPISAGAVVQRRADARGGARQHDAHAGRYGRQPRGDGRGVPAARTRPPLHRTAPPARAGLPQRLAARYRHADRRARDAPHQGIPHAHGRGVSPCRRLSRRCFAWMSSGRHPRRLVDRTAVRVPQRGGLHSLPLPDRPRFPEPAGSRPVVFG